MRNTFTRREPWPPPARLAFGFFSEMVLAQPAGDISQQALLVDSRGAPVMRGFGACVRSGFGPAPQWIHECHGERECSITHRDNSPR